MAQLSLVRPRHTETTRSTSQRIGDWLARYGVPWLFLLPTIVFFVGWAIFPILRVAWISFLDYRPIQASRPITFVGLQNYVQALADPLMMQGLVRAAQFTALFLPGMIFIPMFLAVLIDRIT